MAEHEGAKDVPREPAQRKSLEEYPVSYLHALRQIQGGTPYRPATPHQVLEVTRNGSRRYRVAPHTAQRVLSEWYRKVNGFYNISVTPSEVKSAAQTRKRHRTPPTREDTTVPADEAAPPPEKATASSLQSFRAQKLAQNFSGGGQQKMCAFFNTREGCRRGDLCPFVHLVM